MDSQRADGQRTMGKVLVQKEDRQQFLPGSVQRFEGVPTKQVIQDLETRPERYLDYFIFETPSPDPHQHPENNVVFAVATEAGKYNRAKDETKTSIAFFKPNEVGTLAELPGARYVGMVDRAWDYPVRKVETLVLVPEEQGKKLSPAQQKLADSFVERLQDKIGGTRKGFYEIKQATQATMEELSEFCMGVIRIDIDLMADPEGNAGAKAVKVSVQVLPAPEKISIEGVPDAIRLKVLSEIDAEMDALLQEHPLVASRKRGDVDGTDAKVALVRISEGGTISWRYPANVPEPGGKVHDAIAGFVTGKSMNRVPDAVPGRPMPVPMPVFGKLMKKLNEGLVDQPGTYKLDWDVAADGTVLIAASRSDRPNFFISDDAAAGLKKQYGIDLSEDMARLGEGTGQWSSRRGMEFTKGLQKKFHDAGKELFVDEKWFLSSVSPTSAEIRLENDELHEKAYDELYDPKKVRFTGDVDLEGIGGAARLSEIIGDGPLTLAEFRERLLKVEERYHAADYLILGENPVENADFKVGLQGLQLAFAKNKKDGTVVVIVKVARMGKVRASGAVPQRSIDALVTAIQSPEGKPLRVKEFRQNVVRAMIRLELEEPERDPPVFVLRPDGAMDIIMNVKSQHDKILAGVGTDGHSTFASGAVVFKHKVPGTTHLGVNGIYAFGSERYGGDVFVQSLPLNDDGVFLEAGVGYLRSGYWYRENPDSLEESGVFHRGRGSVIVHVPLGGQGIASPFDLFVGTHGSVVQRDGKTSDDTTVDKTSYYAGNVLGVSSIHEGVLTDGDLIRTRTSVGLDHATTDGRGDSTVGSSVSYAIPLKGYLPTVGEYLSLEISSSVAKRLAVYGGQLPPERYFTEGSIPLIDFGRSFADPYGASYFWNSGLFAVLTSIKILEPMAGTTVSSDGRGGVHGGAGVALRIPSFGLCIYFGGDQDGRPTFGFGFCGTVEL